MLKTCSTIQCVKQKVKYNPLKEVPTSRTKNTCSNFVMIWIYVISSEIQRLQELEKWARINATEGIATFRFRTGYNFTFYEFSISGSILLFPIKGLSIEERVSKVK